MRKKLLKKGLIAAFTAAISVSTILGNFGNKIIVKADGTDPRLYFPDGTPVNTESEDFDPSEDYSKYGLGGAELEEYAKNIYPTSSVVVRAANSISILSLVKAGTYEIKDYPSSVDLSDPNVSSYFPAVGNQRGIGSCCAWATVYYTFTYQNCRAKDVPATGDNIMSAAFPYTQRKADRNNGGVFDNQICDVLKTEGTPSRTICEFESFSSEHGVESWYPKKEIWMNAAEHRLEKFERLSDPGQVTSPHDSDLDEIKGYLNDGHLVNFITYMTGSKNMKIPAGSPHAGEMIRVATSNKGCHEMTIVGYDDDIFVDINGNGTIEEAEKGAFKVVNSWGESYGQKGFIWFSYDSLNHYSACEKNPEYRPQSVFSPSVQFVGEHGKQSSGLFFVVKLNTKRRCDNRVIIRAKNKATGKSYEKPITAFEDNNIFECSLYGRNMAEDGEMAFDLDNVVDDITIDTLDDYEWSVEVQDNKAQNKTILKDAYIEYKGDVYKRSIEQLEVDDSSKVAVLTDFIDGKTAWDIKGNESTVGLERILTTNAKLNGKDLVDPEYKFALVENDKVTYLCDYSKEKELKWTPDKVGDFRIRTYCLYGGKEYYYDNVFKINKRPEVSKLNCVISSLFVNNTVNLNVTTAGGTGKVNINDLYVVGGNYADGKETIHVKKAYGTTFRWIPEMDGEYDIYVELTDSLGAKETVKARTVTIEKQKALEIDSFTISDNENIRLDESINLSVIAKYGTGNYKYRFGLICNGKEYYYKADPEFNGSSTIFATPTEFMPYPYTSEDLVIGNDTFFVDVMDVKTEEVVRSTIENVNVSGLEIGSIYCYSKDDYSTSDEYETGSVLILTAYVNGDIYGDGNAEATFMYSVDDGKSYKELEKSDSNYRYEFKDTDKPGKYLFKYVYKDGVGQTAEKIIEVTIVDKKTKQAVIYYDNAWDTAYIHYAVDGKWTEVPGSKMKASDKAGYKWMYSIDLSGHTGADICFNNGNGAWDSANEKNYQVGCGVYGIKNGKIEEIERKAVIYYNNNSWNEAYIHYSVNGKWTVAPGVKMEKSDKNGYRWMAVINLGNSAGADICFNDGNDNWDSMFGQNYHVLNGEYEIANGRVTRKR